MKIKDITLEKLMNEIFKLYNDNHRLLTIFVNLRGYNHLCDVFEEQIEGSPLKNNQGTQDSFMGHLIIVVPVMQHEDLIIGVCD